MIRSLTVGLRPLLSLRRRAALTAAELAVAVALAAACSAALVAAFVKSPPPSNLPAP